MGHSLRLKYLAHHHSRVLRPTLAIWSLRASLVDHQRHHLQYGRGDLLCSQILEGEGWKRLSSFTAYPHGLLESYTVVWSKGDRCSHSGDWHRPDNRNRNQVRSLPGSLAPARRDPLLMTTPRVSTRIFTLPSKNLDNLQALRKLQQWAHKASNDQSTATASAHLTFSSDSAVESRLFCKSLADVQRCGRSCIMRRQYVTQTSGMVSFAHSMEQSCSDCFIRDPLSEVATLRYVARSPFLLSSRCE